MIQILNHLYQGVGNDFFQTGGVQGVFELFEHLRAQGVSEV